MKTTNNNWKNAMKYFNDNGMLEGIENPRLHHKDVNLKTDDPERYAEWRIEDLVPMSLKDHMKLHMKLKVKKGTHKSRTQRKRIGAGVKAHNKQFANCLWVLSKTIDGIEQRLVFKTCIAAAKAIGVTKQAVSQCTRPNSPTKNVKGWSVSLVNIEDIVIGKEAK